MLYGVLKSNTNTGSDAELAYVFSTPLAVISNQPAFVSDTLSLKRKTSSQNVQRWEIEANIVPSNNSSNFLVHSVRYGHDKTFAVRMPQVYNEGSTFPKVLSLKATNTVLAGADTINISGLIDNEMPEGEFIKFASHNKVYVVVEKGSNGGGVKIFPPLLQNVTANTDIKYGAEVVMTARYDLDTRLGIAYTDGILSDPGVIRFIEAI